MLNNFTIIEDASPYYVRFTFPGLEDLIAEAKRIYDDNEFQAVLNGIVEKEFQKKTMTKEAAEKFLAISPFTNLDLETDRFAYFVSKPHLKHRIHKDGLDIRCGINLPILICDESCITSWYAEDDPLIKVYGVEGEYMRDLKGRMDLYNDTPFVPVKTTIFRPGEAVLINTDIWHRWHNDSPNDRIQLTLRFRNWGDVYFDDVKKLLFGDS